MINMKSKAKYIAYLTYSCFQGNLGSPKILILTKLCIRNSVKGINLEISGYGKARTRDFKRKIKKKIFFKNL